MIYCVEDERSIRELVVYSLNNTGFEAVGFENGALLFSALSREIPTLILLDVMLPGDDGFTILKKIRANPSFTKIPVIMLTAKNTEFDKVTGLDSGADDYVAKPFGMMELISRIKAVLRRSQSDSPKKSSLYQAHGIFLDEDKHIVTVNNHKLDLTLKEFDLLAILLKNPDIVLTRDMLLQSVWGYDFDGETRTVDVHVRSLRQKLSAASIDNIENIIETVRGVGYRLNQDLFS